MQGQHKKVPNKEEEQNSLEFYDHSLESLVDFCQMQAWEMLTHSQQINNLQSISKHTQGLQLSNMIQVGDILPDRDKFIKFRIGFRPIIQKIFEQLKNNAKTPSWKQITTTQVEFVAISKDIEEKQDCSCRSLTSQDMGPTIGHLRRESRSKE